ncbi:MAG: AAA family ATPase, partial [Gemmatimonadaceae bacterium]
GIRAIVDDSLTPWYEGFVAGPSWSQTLRDPKYWFGTLIVIALVVGPVIAGMQNKRKAAREAAEFQRQLAAQRQNVDRLRFKLNVDPTLSTSTPASPAPDVIIPSVPDELVEVCASGDCVLFGGVGLSQQAGLPSSVEVLSALMERSGAKDDTIASAMNAGRYDEVAEVLATRMQRSDILATFQALYADPTQRATSTHNALAKIPFAGVVSTAWDQLLESAFTVRHATLRTVTPNDTSDPVTNTTKELVVAKPFGSLTDAQSFRFTDEEMFGAIGTNRAFASTIAFLLGTKSVLFLGTSSRRIQDFLSRLQLRLEPKRPHFALLPRQTNSLLQDEILRTKYGIQVIGFDATPGFPEVAGFVRALSSAVEKAQPTAERSHIAPAVVREVHLRNIGAFRRLDLTFGPQWNVLLGNNGSGKSTLLRAIALGLCGDDRDAEPYADKLLRTAERSGTIEIVVGDITCRTELIRDGSKVRVKSQLTAFSQGKWVVLGFPPLRGVSTRDPSGLTAPSEPRPVVGDLLPLIKGSIDERLNDLKQWIVNVDADANNAASPNQQRAKALRAGFFELLRKVTPGVTLDFAQVSRDPWRVLVKTEDGDVPIDQVSQGMSSIFGWVGTMLQRMYEIHTTSEEPRTEPAVVLVDELEAHLHPEWQQRIVALIREFFPKLQIIATSHSPLVVVGMKANEVYIARRNREDRSHIDIEPVPPEIDFASLRADQILTSDLFGLSTTRGPDASRIIEEYTKLRAKPEPTDDEKVLIVELRDKLLGLHGSEENPARRQVTEAVTKTLRDMVDKSLLTKDGEIAPELAHEVRRRLDKVMLPSSDDEGVQAPKEGVTR